MLKHKNFIKKCLQTNYFVRYQKRGEYGFLKGVVDSLMYPSYDLVFYENANFPFGSHSISKLFEAEGWTASMDDYRDTFRDLLKDSGYTISPIEPTKQEREFDRGVDIKLRYFKHTQAIFGQKKVLLDLPNRRYWSLASGGYRDYSIRYKKSVACFLDASVSILSSALAEYCIDGPLRRKNTWGMYSNSTGVFADASIHKKQRDKYSFYVKSSKTSSKAIEYTMLECPAVCTGIERIPFSIYKRVSTQKTVINSNPFLALEAPVTQHLYQAVTGVSLSDNLEFIGDYFKSDVIGGAKGLIDDMKPMVLLDNMYTMDFCNRLSALHNLDPVYKDSKNKPFFLDGKAFWTKCAEMAKRFAQSQATHQSFSFGEMPLTLFLDSLGVQRDYKADGYRLPTSFEWQYLASSGFSSKHIYPEYTGDIEYRDAKLSKSFKNKKDKENLTFDERAAITAAEAHLAYISLYAPINVKDSSYYKQSTYTKQVGGQRVELFKVKEKLPNSWGFYDLATNVNEYVEGSNFGLASSYVSKDLEDRVSYNSFLDSSFLDDSRLYASLLYLDASNSKIDLYFPKYYSDLAFQAISFPTSFSFFETDGMGQFKRINSFESYFKAFEFDQSCQNPVLLRLPNDTLSMSGDRSMLRTGFRIVRTLFENSPKDIIVNI